MIEGLFNHGAIPALERMVQFTSARHKVLANDIANLDTPYFKPRDLDVKAFRAQLGEAIDARRSGKGGGQTDGGTGPLRMRDTDDVHFRAHGIDVKPRASDDNILFHDRNNRDLDRIMQHLAENTMAHNASIDLLRSEFAALRTAIRGRV